MNGKPACLFTWLDILSLRPGERACFLGCSSKGLQSWKTDEYSFIQDSHIACEYISIERLRDDWPHSLSSIDRYRHGRETAPLHQPFQTRNRGVFIQGICHPYFVYFFWAQTKNSGISRTVPITEVYFSIEILQKMKSTITSVVLAIPFLIGKARASLNCTATEAPVTERACEYTACAALETATIGQVLQAACRADCSNEEEYRHEPFFQPVVTLPVQWRAIRS